MKKKIFTLTLVLFGWIISADAQTLKFLPDTTEKSILVFKQSVSGDTLVFLKKVVVSEVLAENFSTETLIGTLNKNQSDTFVYEISVGYVGTIPSRYLILPPTAYTTYNCIGMYFYTKEILFKPLKYPRTVANNLFNGNLVTGISMLSLSIILLLVLMLCAKFILAKTLGIRISHDIALYLLLYLLMSTFFSYAICWTFFDLRIMIFFILPTLISALSTHFIIKKKFG